MLKFAVIKDNVIINTVMAESKEIAESLNEGICIECTEESAEPGGTYINGKFIKKKPYPSWISDGKDGWKSPIDMPEVDLNNPKLYTWDESKINWIEVSL
jgi:hypothetical protein